MTVIRWCSPLHSLGSHRRYRLSATQCLREGVDCGHVEASTTCPKRLIPEKRTTAVVDILRTTRIVYLKGDFPAGCEPFLRLFGWWCPGPPAAAPGCAAWCLVQALRPGPTPLVPPFLPTSHRGGIGRAAASELRPSFVEPLRMSCGSMWPHLPSKAGDAPRPSSLSPLQASSGEATPRLLTPSVKVSIWATLSVCCTLDPWYRGFFALLPPSWLSLSSRCSR